MLLVLGMIIPKLPQSASLKPITNAEQ